MNALKFSPLPHLQVLPALDALEAHTIKWADNAELTAALRKDAVSTIRAGRMKHYHAALPLAFLLDPTNFEVITGRGSSVFNFGVLYVCLFLN